MPSTIEIVGSALFACAVLHVVVVKRFLHLARLARAGSLARRVFHLLGEMELVFGIWAGIFVLVFCLVSGPHAALNFVRAQTYSEVIFVLSIMTVAATSPVMEAVAAAVLALSKLSGAKDARLSTGAILFFGPLLGSLITEPAAMTISALLLEDALFGRAVSQRLRYSVLGVLLVNISVGGVLTHFAAPPVIMVASVWNWGLKEMFCRFGWKAALAVLVNALLVVLVFRKELAKIPLPAPSRAERAPRWLTLLHFFFLGLLVIEAHHSLRLLGILFVFLICFRCTRKYQQSIRIREASLVAVFLLGLVLLVSQQGWWLKPLMAYLSPVTLFLAALGLTAIVDNAALTLLGAQVSGIGDGLKYALVAGAVTGGGLTVIANAPNPAAIAILSESFGAEGVSPLLLFLSALLPTMVAALCFWALP